MILNRKKSIKTNRLGGGDEEDRTPDLRIANATLSQLSYVPTICHVPTACNSTAPVRARASASHQQMLPSVVPTENDIVHLADVQKLQTPRIRD